MTGLFLVLFIPSSYFRFKPELLLQLSLQSFLPGFLSLLLSEHQDSEIPFVSRELEYFFHDEVPAIEVFLSFLKHCDPSNLLVVLDRSQCVNCIIYHFSFVVGMVGFRHDGADSAYRLYPFLEPVSNRQLYFLFCLKSAALGRFVVNYFFYIPRWFL